MLILSLDTTTRVGSCAVVRDDRVLGEHTGDATLDQAQRLPGDLATLLATEAIALEEISAFAVATGPGSFTGLRVGIAAMQGLAMATGKPLIGVSSFDALVRLAGEPRGVVAAWIDAWRGEVFAAVFDQNGLSEEPIVAPPDRLIEGLAGRDTVFTGDGAALYESRIRASLGSSARFTIPTAPLLAGAIALIAADAYRAGQRPLPHAVRPLYVRRSDAELAADRKGR